MMVRILLIWATFIANAPGAMAGIELSFESAKSHVLTVLSKSEKTRKIVEGLAFKVTPSDQVRVYAAFVNGKKNIFISLAALRLVSDLIASDVHTTSKRDTCHEDYIRYVLERFNRGVVEYSALSLKTASKRECICKTLNKSNLLKNRFLRGSYFSSLKAAFEFIALHESGHFSVEPNGFTRKDVSVLEREVDAWAIDVWASNGLTISSGQAVLVIFFALERSQSADELSRRYDSAWRLQLSVLERQEVRSKIFPEKAATVILAEERRRLTDYRSRMAALLKGVKRVTKSDCK